LSHSGQFVSPLPYYLVGIWSRTTTNGDFDLSANPLPKLNKMVRSCSQTIWQKSPIKLFRLPACISCQPRKTIVVSKSRYAIYAALLGRNNHECGETNPTFPLFARILT